MSETLGSPRPSGFQQRLGDELETLVRLHAAADSPPRPRLTRFRLPLAVTAVAAGVAAAVALPVLSVPGQGAQSIGSAAYAVTEESDGTLLLRLDNRKGLKGFEEALVERGVDAAVREPDPQCADPRPEIFRDASTGILGPREGDPPNSVRMDPEAIPDDGHLLLSALFTADGSLVVLHAALVEDIPRCLLGSGATG